MSDSADDARSKPRRPPRSASKDLAMGKWHFNDRLDCPCLCVLDVLVMTHEFLIRCHCQVWTDSFWLVYVVQLLQFLPYGPKQMVSYDELGMALNFQVERRLFCF